MLDPSPFVDIHTRQNLPIGGVSISMVPKHGLALKNVFRCTNFDQLT
jgi:hypothetical protein